MSLLILTKLFIYIYLLRGFWHNDGSFLYKHIVPFKAYTFSDSNHTFPVLNNLYVYPSHNISICQSPNSFFKINRGDKTCISSQFTDITLQMHDSICIVRALPKAHLLTGA